MKTEPTRARHAYTRVLRLLHLRDPREQQAIAEDAARMLEDARARGRTTLALTWLGLTWDLATGTGRDLARAFRALVRAPGFSLSVSLLLGLGVAATTTLFALVHTVLLAPLPLADPDRLVMVWETNVPQSRVREGPAPGNLNDWIAAGDAFDALTGWWTASATLRGTDGSMPVRGVQVTSGFFEVFGRTPLHGRTFAAGEYPGRPSIASGRAAGGEPSLVLSHHLWRSLGADPALVGRTLHIEGRHWRVLGIMPADFAVPDADAGFWTPWDMHESYRGDRFPDGLPRDFRFLRVVGRLKSGLTREEAETRLNVLAATAAADHPRTNVDWSVQLVPLREELVRTSRTELLLVFGAVFALLLLACANVASLTIARRTARVREIAIRLALGASQTRIMREHLAETALCAVLTAAVAMAATAFSLGAAVAWAPSDIPRLHEVDFGARVVVFALALAVVVTTLGVFVPGVRRRGPAISPALKDGAPAGATRTSRVRRVLVVAEIGVTVVLLAGAGLLVRSFAELRRVDLGFDVGRLIVLRIAPDVTKYRDQRVVDYYGRVLDALRAMPGVTSAAAVTALPMSTVGSDFYRPYWPEGPRPGGSAVSQANVRMATAGYFATMGLPLVAGCEFSSLDTQGAPAVVIVNESLAQRAWNGLDPVGRTLTLDYQGGPTARRVIGVVRDARYRGPRSQPAPEVFLPHPQNPYLVMNVVVRTTAAPEQLIRTARARAQAVDPDQPVHSVTTMGRLLDDSLQQDRFAMLFVALFAAAGAVTAASGVFALLAYTVGQRRREIAVRLAIGATPALVARLILSEALGLAAAGAALGAIGLAAVSRVTRSMLFGIAADDPPALVATAALLLLLVLAASWVPARRASRVDACSVMRI